MTKEEFDPAFSAYHKENAKRYSHLVKWTPVPSALMTDVMKKTGVTFPQSFLDYMGTYGYGDIYFNTIFCPLIDKPQGCLYTIWEYRSWPQFDGAYLPISSNGCELWAGYKITDGYCSERLFDFDVDEGDYTGKQYMDIWEFLKETALVIM